MISVLGDFQAKSNSWCRNDAISHEDSMIGALTSIYRLHHLIQEPKHIPDWSFFCVDLIFTSQPNLVMESGVHSSLRPNWYHQVVFAKFSLSILYPSPFEITVWFYMKKQMLNLSEELFKIIKNCLVYLPCFIKIIYNTLQREN